MFFYHVRTYFNRRHAQKCNRERRHVRSCLPQHARAQGVPRTQRLSGQGWLKTAIKQSPLELVVIVRRLDVYRSHVFRKISKVYNTTARTKLNMNAYKSALAFHTKGVYTHLEQSAGVRRVLEPQNSLVVWPEEQHPDLHPLLCG